jgi:hypothetical protein
VTTASSIDSTISIELIHLFPGMTGMGFLSAVSSPGQAGKGNARFRGPFHVVMRLVGEAPDAAFGFLHHSLVQQQVQVMPYDRQLDIQALRNTTGSHHRVWGLQQLAQDRFHQHRVSPHGFLARKIAILEEFSTRAFDPGPGLGIMAPDSGKSAAQPGRGDGMQCAGLRRALRCGARQGVAGAAGPDKTAQFIFHCHIFCRGHEKMAGVIVVS